MFFLLKGGREVVILACVMWCTRVKGGIEAGRGQGESKGVDNVLSLLCVYHSINDHMVMNIITETALTIIQKLSFCLLESAVVLWAAAHSMLLNSPHYSITTKLLSLSLSLPPFLSLLQI